MHNNVVIWGDLTPCKKKRKEKKASYYTAKATPAIPSKTGVSLE